MPNIISPVSIYAYFDETINIIANKKVGENQKLGIHFSGKADILLIG
jgi:hypothetical protein